MVPFIKGLRFYRSQTLPRFPTPKKPMEVTVARLFEGTYVLQTRHFSVLCSAIRPYYLRARTYRDGYLDRKDGSNQRASPLTIGKYVTSREK